MSGGIYRVFAVAGGLCVLSGVLLGLAYYKGRYDANVKCNLANNREIISVAREKEKISEAVARKSVSDKRKDLGRYVVKGD